MLEDRQLLSTYTVTSTLDDGSKGTLRAAINAVDAGTDNVINFKIPGTGVQTINLTSALPTITANGVTINGLSQGGKGNTTPLIELNGTNAGSSSGLVLAGSNCKVSGLIIENFQFGGIGIIGSNNTIGGIAAGSGNVLSGNGGGLLIGSGATGTVVQGNFIGIDVSGLNALGNANEGILIDGSNNTIGGTVAGARNIISANGSVVGAGGVDVSGSANLIEGNYVGLNSAGTAALGNTYAGIYVNGSSNTIGGTVAGARNVIAGNGYGVNIAGSNSLVEGNYIGTNSQGTSALGNGTGVAISGSDTTIGGTVAGARNIISGNTGMGIQTAGGGVTGVLIEGNYIGTNAAGTGALGNTSDDINVDTSSTTIGGTTAGARNVISASGNDGITIFNTGVAVLGNYIGTNAAGNASLSNAYVGVWLQQGTGDTIGGTAAGDRNVISGNTGNSSLGTLAGGGIVLAASGVAVQGNYIGINAAGTSALPNATGIWVYGLPNDTIGGAVAGARNVISGNTGLGISFFSGGITLSGTLIQGNYIGTNAAGSSAVGNGQGIGVEGSGNTIGGVTAAARNVISGNTGSGVVLVNGSSGNLVEGDFIGLDSSGKVKVGNGSDGIVDNGISNTIGGTVGGARNVISGNASDGILVEGAASGAQVLGNYIGTDVTGTKSLSNNGYGVEIAGNSNTIGNGARKGSNVIAFNSLGGVNVLAGSDNTIRLNSIFANGSSQTGPGISEASNSNNSIVAPTITSATLIGTTLTIKGTFSAPTANVTYVLEFYANPTGDGEGKIYLGSKTVKPTKTGTIPFVFSVNTTVTGTDPLITATLTDSTGDTSVFSNGAMS